MIFTLGKCQKDWKIENMQAGAKPQFWIDIRYINMQKEKKKATNFCYLAALGISPRINF